MRVRQPGVHRPHRQFDREGGEEGEPKERLHRDGEVRRLEQHFDVGGARVEIHPQDGEQHQHRAEQGVEEELEAGIDAPRPAPHPDDEEHRDQTAFEEHIEEDEIERGEHADHQRLQQQERDHVFGDARLDGFPAGQDAEGHEARREHDEQHGDAVHAHVIADAEAEPVGALLELEGSGRAVKIAPDVNRQCELDDSRDQRHPAGGVCRPGRVAARQKNDQRADGGQEGDDAEDRQVAHRRPPVAMNQVASATTPINMAKA